MNKLREGGAHPPRNLQELHDRMRKAHVVIQTHAGVSIREACPFCGAPDFMVLDHRITMDKLVAARTCCECERTIKGVALNSGCLVSVQHNAPYAMLCTIAVEFVQVGGPEQPEWLEPKMKVEK